MKSSMSHSVDLSRRGFLVSLAAVGLAGCATGPQPVANPSLRISHFVVDAEPLRNLGGGYNADYLKKAVTEEANKQFAPFLGGPKDNVLTLQIGALQMPAQPDERFDVGMGGSASNDYLDGVVILKQGAQVNQYKFLTVSASSSGGAWYLPDNVWRRETALAKQYVDWVRREIFGSF
ncbi:MAG: twin-arginine translocation signal domain-containing protein [Beijerinckiaceae bacterium]|nr:twin-arginine translocation signal domain-containing protein [Beijerinckiaceae bacterium]